MKKGKAVNFDYYRLLKAIASQHAYYDGVIQAKTTTLQDFKAKELSKEEQAALADAETYIPTYSVNGKEKVKADKRYHPNNVPMAKVYTYGDYIPPENKQVIPGSNGLSPNSGYVSGSEELGHKGPKPVHNNNKSKANVKELDKKKVTDKNGNKYTVYVDSQNPDIYYDADGNEMEIEI